MTTFALFTGTALGASIYALVRRVATMPLTSSGTVSVLVGHNRLRVATSMLPERLRTLARHGRLRVYPVGTPKLLPVHEPDDKAFELPRRTPGLSLEHNPAPDSVSLHTTEPSTDILRLGTVRNVLWTTRCAHQIQDWFVDLSIWIREMRTRSVAKEPSDELRTWWSQGISTSAHRPTVKERREYTGHHRV